MSTIVINLFGAPSAGKSTGAAYIFSRLKMIGINAEYITEFAKDMVWGNNIEALDDQAYVFGNQSYRLSRCNGKVDVIITDSPLPLSILYKNKDGRFTSNFDKAVMDSFNYYNNVNYYITRVKPYNPVGRLQTESEAEYISNEVLSLLNRNNIPYISVTGTQDSYEEIITHIKSLLGM